MDSGLRIVLSDHTAASWRVSWVWPLRGGYCQDHVQLWTIIQLLCQVRTETDEGREQRAGQEVSPAGVGDCMDSTTKDNKR